MKVITGLEVSVCGEFWSEVTDQEFVPSVVDFVVKFVGLHPMHNVVARGRTSRCDSIEPKVSGEGELNEWKHFSKLYACSSSWEREFLISKPQKEKKGKHTSA